jgi:hypothetical protein
MVERNREPSADIPPLLKSQIVLEERYRSEVKHQLSGAAEPQNKFIKFFNSALGIWLLSTVVVSVFGALYTSAHQSFEKRRVIEQEQRNQEQVRDAAIRKLDVEISFRLANLMSFLNGVRLQQAEQSSNRVPVVQLMPERLSLMLQIPPEAAVQHSFPSLTLFHENRSKTLANLLAELSLLEGQRSPANRENEAGELGPADQIMSSLARISDLTSFFEVKKLLDRSDNAELVASAIQSDIFLSRWRQNAFFYTDCSASVPFC